jgi:CRP-like cAMP-binding protein
MASSDWGLLQPALGSETGLVPEVDDLLDCQAAVSAALASVFRGKLCDLIRPNRKTTTFNKHQVIYNMGDGDRTLFFLQNGFVKVGTISANGREVIYDVRKGGDVIGELCASEQVRPDRAVALEQTDALAVPFQEVMELLLRKPDLIALLVDVLCRALKEAYAQVNTLAIDDTVHRLIKVLVGLATKLGQPSGPLVEIPTYFTQEEIAQMVAARRERISTALNSLRRRGMVQYSTRGHLVLNVSALESRSG